MCVTEEDPKISVIDQAVLQIPSINNADICVLEAAVTSIDKIQTFHDKAFHTAVYRLHGLDLSASSGQYLSTTEVYSVISQNNVSR